jgi:hypothetical protein
MVSHQSLVTNTILIFNTNLNFMRNCENVKNLTPFRTTAIKPSAWFAVAVRRQTDV